MDFANLYVNATLADAQKAGTPVLAWGDFLNVAIAFVIAACVMFLIVRQVNGMGAPAPATEECQHCLSTIPLGATRCPRPTSGLPAA